MKKNILGLILLSPDAAEGASAPEVDPLDMPAGAVDTKFPVIAPQLYDMVIKSAEVGRNKADDGDVMVLKFATTSEAKTRDGDVVHPGFPVTYRIGLTPTKDYSNSAIAKKIAQVAQAVGQNDVTIRSLMTNPKTLEGSIARCKVTVSPEKNGFPESNNIAGFVPVGA